MEYFFKKPLNQIVSLILEQMKFAEAYDRRVKVSNSRIVELEETTHMHAERFHDRWIWRVKTSTGEGCSCNGTMARQGLPTGHIVSTAEGERKRAKQWYSWTAVVLGAAMHGIEKASLSHIRTGYSPRNYGIAHDMEHVKGADDEEHQFESEVTGKIMGRDRMIWIIRRGDLILLSSAESPETLLKFAFNEDGKKDFVIPLYQYLDDDDDNLPLRLKGAAKGMLDHN
jgi:hypothetical protein